MSHDNITNLQKNDYSVAKEIQSPVENIGEIEIEIQSHKTLCSPLLRQIQGTFGSLAAVTSAGMVAGYSAILLPQLETPESGLKVNAEQSSWIASLAVIAMALGSGMIIVLMKYYGRRTLLQALSILAAAGWIVISLSNSIEILYVGRFITGLYVGLMTPVGVIFVAETTHPKHRGLLLSVVNLGVSMGVFIVHVLGTFCSWKFTAVMASIISLVCFLMMLAVAESPTWLLIQKNIEGAQNAFFWFRGSGEKSRSELEELLHNNTFLNNNLNYNRKFNKPYETIKRDIYSNTFIKPFLIMLTFFTAQQFSGFNAIIFYTITMFKNLGDYVNKYLAMIIIDIIRVLVSIISCILLKKYGRRPLTILSGVGTVISLSVLGILYFASIHIKNTLYVPILLLIWFTIYIFTVGIGLVYLPWIMIGEVFSVSTREIGSGLSSCFGFLMFFIVVKTEPNMLETLDTYGVFFTYAVVTAVTTIILYKFLPETKNKTLQSIEDDNRNS